MALFAWSEKYSVNIREIDDQHKKLVGMVGQLHESMRQGKGKQALEVLLRDLIQYTRSHFSAEERLMKTNGYPDYETHKAKHDAMTSKVANIYREYQDGKATITFEVMEFLEQWLDKQIQFDAVWETKVIERILHNLSLLMERSFASVQELNRYRKEMAALVSASAARPGTQGA